MPDTDAVVVLDPVADKVAEDFTGAPVVVLPVATTVADDITEPDTVLDTVTVLTPVVTVIVDIVAMELLAPPAWRENCSDWARMALFPGWAETRLIWKPAPVPWREGTV